MSKGKFNISRKPFVFPSGLGAGGGAIIPPLTDVLGVGNIATPEDILMRLQAMRFGGTDLIYIQEDGGGVLEIYNIDNIGVGSINKVMQTGTDVSQVIFTLNQQSFQKTGFATYGQLVINFGGEDKPFIEFNDIGVGASGFGIDLKMSIPTADRVLLLPDKDGTIATTTDIEDVSASIRTDSSQFIEDSLFIPIVFGGIDYDTGGFFDGSILESGGVTGATATTLTDLGNVWGINVFEDFVVTIVAGTGIGQIRNIISNTADTLTILAWAVVPDITSLYEITAINRLTIPAGQGGKYLLTAKVTFQINAVGFRTLLLEKNGVIIAGSNSGALVGIFTDVNENVVLDLLAGDFITFQIFQNSGGLLATLGTLPNDCVFQLTKQRG